MAPSSVLVRNLPWIAIIATSALVQAQSPTRSAVIPLGTAQAPCPTSCTVTIPEAGIFGWVPISFNTTITAATVIAIVNTVANTTRYSTKYNDLPPGYTLPPTNDAGTQTTTISKTYNHNSTFTTTLAYPTAYQDYPTSYHWGGTLPTTAANGSQICSRGGPQDFPSHPQFSPQPIPTYPRHPQLPPNVTDSVGIYFTPGPAGGSWPQRFYTSAFPGEKAFQVCTANAVGPIMAVQGAMFLTETSTSTESGVPSTSPPPAVSQVQPSTTPSTQPSVTTSPSQPQPSQQKPSQPEPSQPGSAQLGSAQPGSAQPESSQPEPSQPNLSQPEQSQPSPSGTKSGDNAGGIIGSLFGPSATAAPGSNSGNGDAPRPSPTADNGSVNSANGGAPRPSTTAGTGSSSSGSGSGQSNDADSSRSSGYVNGQTMGSGASGDSAFSVVPVVIGGTTFTPNSGLAYVAGSQTLSWATNSAGRSAAVVGGTTYELTTTLPSPTPAPIPNVVIGGSTYTAGANSAFLIGTNVLTPGGSVTVGSGSSTTVVALSTDNSGATVLVAGGSTSTLPSASPSSADMGGLIISGLGGVTGSSSSNGPTGTSSTSSSTGVVAFLGAAAATSRPWDSGMYVALWSSILFGVLAIVL
ncbi:hypothetical protein LTS18_011319 [Coniosporium uncinatum]|uniref:Uncharacterized protein n=1 Tax=Coniosporium uncinatum TaxID=93489 RepID=A0ACC3DW11_9PEZI|nr:hypothetical protein LTS18_011319 [Coniosporium uncinatum]